MVGQAHYIKVLACAWMNMIGFEIVYDYGAKSRVDL